jgi:hypothetical protein
MKPFNRKPQFEDDEPIETFELPQPPNPDFYDPAWDAWREPRRVQPKWIVSILVVAILAVGLMYLIGGSGSSSRSSPSTTAISLSPTTFSIASVPGEASPTKFAGSGSVTTSAFTVSSGLSVLSAECKCSGQDFIIKAISPSGQALGTPINSLGANASGNFSGSVVLQVPPGVIRFQVVAHGPWSASLRYPSPATPVMALPKSWQTIGPSVIGPFPAGKTLGLFYSISGNENPPASLQVFSSTGAAGQTLFSVAMTTGIQYLTIPAQPQAFYLTMSETESNWALQVINTK